MSRASTAIFGVRPIVHIPIPGTSTIRGAASSVGSSVRQRST